MMGTLDSHQQQPLFSCHIHLEHRAVEDAHGVITAVQTTVSTVADGTSPDCAHAF